MFCSWFLFLLLVKFWVVVIVFFFFQKPIWMQSWMLIMDSFPP